MAGLEQNQNRARRANELKVRNCRYRKNGGKPGFLEALKVRNYRVRNRTAENGDFDPISG